MTGKDKIKARLGNISDEVLSRLNDKQVDFIVHPIDKSCFLKACPGSGKTEVVGIKAAYEIAEWESLYTGIAVLSFTKNAAKEIAGRVAKFDGINAAKHPHFIGTIDSWLHGNLLHPYGHMVAEYSGVKRLSGRRSVLGDKSFSIIENDSKATFLSNSDFKTTYQTEKGRSLPFNATQYSLGIKGQPESNTVEKELPKSLRLEELVSKKKNFHRAGFCTYSDAEYLCYRLLNENENLLDTIAKRYPVIMIDECQDLSELQIALFFRLFEKGIRLLLIGDINQSIFDFRKADGERLLRFIDYCKFTRKVLLINYRSNQQVVDVCQGIIGLSSENEALVDSVIGKEAMLMTQNVFVWEYENVEDLPKRFIDFINEKNGIIVKSCDEDGETRIIRVSNSAILGRSHAFLSAIRSDTDSKFNQIELFANALACWNLANRTTSDVQKALLQIGKSISLLAYYGKGNHQSEYCPEEVGQIEWRLFLHQLLEDASLSLFPFNKKNWTDWTKELKLFLEEYWPRLPIEGIEWQIGKSKKGANAKVGSPKGFATDLVSKKINTREGSDSEKVRISTFHDVKGETLDAVLVVSTPTALSKGGNWKHWLGMTENPKLEHRRFAYVASSRPKHLLIWAIKKGTKANLKDFEKLGFNIDSIKKTD